jgi:hypothetical protein
MAQSHYREIDRRQKQQERRERQIKLERPKKVEATHQEGIICVGGFSNPLF